MRIKTEKEFFRKAFEKNESTNIILPSIPYLNDCSITQIEKKFII